MATPKTTKRVLRSQASYIVQDKHFEHPKGASVTVPDESFTIAQILQRSQQGLASDLMHQGEYTLDDQSENFDAYDIEKLKQLDPYDREMLARHLAAENAKHKQYLEEYEAKKRADDEVKAQEQEDARIAAFLERQEKKSKPASNDAKGGTTAS